MGFLMELTTPQMYIIFYTLINCVCTKLMDPIILRVCSGSDFHHTILCIVLYIYVHAVEKNSLTCH